MVGVFWGEGEWGKAPSQGVWVEAGKGLQTEK